MQAGRKDTLKVPKLADLNRVPTCKRCLSDIHTPRRWNSVEHYSPCFSKIANTLGRVNTAIACRLTERLPILIPFGSLMLKAEGADTAEVTFTAMKSLDAPLVSSGSFASLLHQYTIW